jgi:hypothetical protein
VSARDWKSDALQVQRNLLNAYELRELLAYDPISGVLTWKKNMTPRARAGKEAGVIQCGKYRRIGINGKYYMAHRIAWVIVTGSWPEYQIDHKNGMKSDNRWTNLREATSAQNKHNTEHRNNSGLIGASLHAGTGRYRAQIRTGGKRKFLGWFETAQEAHDAYKQAAIKYHGEFAKC